MDNTEYSLLLNQFGPSAEDKAAARNMALMQAGLGILAANKPSATPQSRLGILAQGGLQGLQGYQQDLAFRTGERRNAGLTALTAAKLKKDLASTEALKNFYASPTPQGPTMGQLALTAGAQEGDIGPTQTNLKRLDAFQTNPPPAPAQVPNFGALIVAGVPGETVKAMMEDWKLKNPEMRVDGGYAYNPRGIQPGFIPQVKLTDDGKGVGITPGPGGGLPSVSALPGSLPTFTQFADAQEAAKARREPFMGLTDSTGRPLPMTREGFATQFGGVGIPGAAVPPRGVGQTPGERESQVTAAQGDAKRVLDLEAKIPSILSVQRRLGRMEQLTADDTTYAAAGAELKNTLGSIGQAFGLKINQAKTANTEEYLAHVAELLKDRLASKDFGSGSGVSNLDIIAARAPLPELAKTSAGRMQIIAALRADTERNLKDAQSARDYFDANKGLRGFRFPSEVEAERGTREDRVRNLGRDGRQSQIPQGVTVKRIK